MGLVKSNSCSICGKNIIRPCSNPTGRRFAPFLDQISLIYKLYCLYKVINVKNVRINDHNKGPSTSTLIPPRWHCKVAREFICSAFTRLLHPRVWLVKLLEAGRHAVFLLPSLVSFLGFLMYAENLANTSIPAVLASGCLGASLG